MALRYGGVFEQDNVRYLLSSSALDGSFEGDYTAWEFKWDNLIPNNLGYTDEILYDIDERYSIINIVWEDDDNDTRWGTFNLVDFSTIFLSTAGTDYAHYPYDYLGGMRQGKVNFNYGGISKSAQTYFLLHRADYYTNEVWRGGTLLWARDLRDDVEDATPTADCGLISLSGKYVLLLYEDDDNKYRLVLYEGGTAV